MTVGEIEAKMSAREFGEWMAWFRLQDGASAAPDQQQLSPLEFVKALHG